MIRDSIVYTETVKFDTIILVSPADTLIIRIPVEPDINDLVIDASNKPGPSLKIKIKDGILEAEVICPEDSLKAVIHSLETELKERTVITPPTPEPERYTGKFAKFTMIFFFCCVFITGVLIVYRIKVGTLKSALNRLTNKGGD